MERMFLTSLFLHLSVLIYQNVFEKSFEKFQEIYSEEVDLYIGQRFLHLSAYEIIFLVGNLSS